MLENLSVSFVCLWARFLNYKVLSRGRTDHFSTENSTNNRRATVACTFGDAVWRFIVHTSSRNVHPWSKFRTVMHDLEHQIDL